MPCPVIAFVLPLLLAGLYQAAKAWRREQDPTDTRVPTAKGVIAFWFTYYVGALAVVVGCLVALWHDSPWAYAWVPLPALTAVLVLSRSSAVALVPFGRPRFLFRFCQIGSSGGWCDPVGSVALLSSLAILRQRPPSAADIAWVEWHINNDDAVRGAGMVALGVLALARGDRGQARCLFHGIDHVDPQVLPRRAAKLAYDWLIADAASRGKWRRVHRLAARGVHPRSRLARFLFAAAPAILRLPHAPGRFVLTMLWLLAPHRRWTRSLLRRACGSPVERGQEPPTCSPSPVPPVETADGAPPSDGHPLHRTLRMHAVLLERPRLRNAELRSVSAAWRSALGGRKAKEWVLRRAAFLGASDPKEAAHGVARAVDADLAALLRRSKRPIAGLVREEGPLGAAARMLRDGMMGEIETVCRRTRGRADAKKPLPPADEWREWQAFRVRCEEAFRLGGDLFRRTAWDRVNWAITGLGCWLWIDRKERPMANAMFRWLYDQARAVDDASAIERQQKNIDSGV